MKSIYKYIIDINGHRFGVNGPITKLLSVQVQRSQVYVWAEVDTDMPNRYFGIFPIGTGWDLDKITHFDEMTYLGTVQLYGDLVWHMYYAELTEPLNNTEYEWE